MGPQLDRAQFIRPIAHRGLHDRNAGVIENTGPAFVAAIDGGWSTVAAAGRAAGKFDMWDLSADPRRVYTLWAGVLGGVALTLATHGTDQFLVQRLLSARSSAHAATTRRARPLRLVEMPLR